jgi:hypothetical protein
VLVPGAAFAVVIVVVIIIIIIVVVIIVIIVTSRRVAVDVFVLVDDLKRQTCSRRKRSSSGNKSKWKNIPITSKNRKMYILLTALAAEAAGVVVRCAAHGTEPRASQRGQRRVLLQLVEGARHLVLCRDMIEVWLMFG